MKPTNTDNMTCLLLGHNYYKLATADQSHDSIICKCCGSNSVISPGVDFLDNIYENKTFTTALRKLFLLKRSI